MNRLLIAGLVSAVALTGCSNAFAAASKAPLGVPGMPAGSTGPLDVSTSVSPGWIYFADTVNARIDVLFDPHQVRAGSILVVPSFSPWQEIGTPTVSTSTTGSVARRTWQFTIACITYNCLPKGTTAESFHLQAFTVSAVLRNGSPVRSNENWPTVKVAGRFLPPATGSVRPGFTLQTGLPAPRYRFSARRLADLVDAAGAILVALGVASIGYRLLSEIKGRRRALDERASLQVAITLVRQAQERDPGDRRRAVGLLARALASEQQDGLAVAASEIAWSENRPSPTRMAGLVEIVESELEAAE